MKKNKHAFLFNILAENNKTLSQSPSYFEQKGNDLIFVVQKQFNTN